MTKQTGSHLMLDALLEAGVDTIFGNPGTSEMHLTAAIADYPEIEKVLCLFEGGATGAADGYGRMKGKPAATLLHLGPGLANGLANIHNAKKAGTPMINVIGDHTTFHKQYDAPLNSDIEGTAAPYSQWIRTVAEPTSLGTDTSEAISAAVSHGGQISSLIVPADIAWSDRKGKTPAFSVEREKVNPAILDAAIGVMKNGRKTGLIVGREALYGEGLKLAGQIAAATGATLFFPYASARVQRGAGLPATKRIPFPVEAAVEMLASYEQLLMIGAVEPVAFFAYPGKPSCVVPETADLLNVVTPREDVLAALHYIADQTGGDAIVEDPTPVPDPASGPLTTDTLMRTVANAMQEGMILAEEGVTTTRALLATIGGCPQHDYLTNVGGSIGAGLPLALGAAIACPDRPVLCISGDGSASYTHQVLWSMARHKLNVTIVICANHSYQILKGEMYRVGAMKPDGPRNPLLELDDPRLDWVSLAKGYGVDSLRCETAEELDFELRKGLATPGPVLIEAALQPVD
ncbi:acetolactate synthase-1/2/3 large subunit [Shimia gijangensis]|uniref:Acetolactate synthase-1/2/3 large subunit n=1 Tax=Shimia gijangensis TaxID=1470563 RepID=A0A1M6CFK3_9RHOB|nr:acetolactate synthase large subunit [Shimia gijangensis]SHI59782.1 acetolactate synthase-1/2/3 large subunit [Shimia gijangensis]